MTIAQTVDIPANRRLTVKAKVPAGGLAGERWIPLVSWLRGRRREAQTRALLRFYGSLADSPAFAGSPVEIQRKMRAEWDRPWDAPAGEA